MTKLTKRATAILRKADIILTKEDNWTRGKLDGSDKGSGPYCLLGAVYAAAGEDIEYEGDEAGIHSKPAKDAVIALAGRITRRKKLDISAAEGYIWRFNDRADDVKTVRALIARTIKAVGA